MKNFYVRTKAKTPFMGPSYLQRQSAVAHNLSAAAPKEIEADVEICVPHIKGRSVLCVGTRDGLDMRLFSQRGCKTAGVEIDKPTVETLQNQGLDVYYADMHDLSVIHFQDRKFQMVFARHVLEHSYNHKLVLYQLVKCLEQQGYLYLVCPLEDKFDPNHYVRFGSLQEIRRLLDDFGFDIVQSEVRDAKHGRNAVVLARLRRQRLLMASIGSPCNLNCSYCYSTKANKVSHPVSIDTWKKFLDSSDCKWIVSLCGTGETSLIEHFGETCRLLTEQRNTVLIVSNMVSPKIEDILESRLNYVCMTLSVHWDQWKQRNLREEVLRRVRRLTERGVLVNPTLILTPEFVKHAPEIANIVMQETGLRIAGKHYRPEIGKRWMLDDMSKAICNNYLYMEMYEEDCRFAETKDKPCTAGEWAVHLKQDGTFWDCECNYNILGKMEEGVPRLEGVGTCKWECKWCPVPYRMCSVPRFGRPFDEFAFWNGGDESLRARLSLELQPPEEEAERTGYVSWKCDPEVTFIVPAYHPGAEKLQRCIESIRRQQGHFRVIVAVDGNDKKTFDLAQGLVAGDSRFEQIRCNATRLYALWNIIETLKDVPDDNIVALVDVDDFLLGSHVVTRLKHVYSDPSVEVVWTNLQWLGKPDNWNGAQTQGYGVYLRGADYYEEPWLVSHLRTFRKSVYNRVPTANFVDEEGNYFKRAYDQALILPMLHICKSWRNIDEELYCYDQADHPEVDKIGAACEKFIRKRGFVEGCAPEISSQVERVLVVEPSREKKSSLSPEVPDTKKPKITVVVPCFNHGKYLLRSLNSIVGQTLDDWEAIVVNDGSTDDTSDVTRKFQQLYGEDKIRLIEQENRGLSGARNTGFRAAKADVILPLDVDNVLKPHALHRYYEVMKQNQKIGVAFTDIERMSGRVFPQYYNRDNIRDHNTVDACAAIRKSAWEAAGGYDESLRRGYEDWDFWLRCTKVGIRFGKIEGLALFIYDDVRSGRMMDKCFQMHEELVKEVKSKHPDIYGDQASASVQSFVRENTIDVIQTSTERAEVSLSVIVSAYNQRSVLKLALESYKYQTVVPKEVIVADDGSSDGTLDWLDTLEDNVFGFPVRYVTRAHRGYRLASLNNFGAKAAKGTRLLFTNADVLHSPESFESHSALNPKQIGNGIIHGINIRGVPEVEEILVDHWEEILELAKKFPTDRTNRVHLNSPPNPSTCWSGNFSIKTDEFWKVDGYDESYVGWGAEDGNLVIALVSSGCNLCWVKNSIGIHLDHKMATYRLLAKGCKRYTKSHSLSS